MMDDKFSPTTMTTTEGAHIAFPFVESKKRWNKRTPSSNNNPDGCATTTTTILPTRAGATTAAAASTPRKEQCAKRYKRSGKWTKAEEEYASNVIVGIASGSIEIPPGKSIRSYLAEQLECDPMRISKKFPGTRTLMKQIVRNKLQFGSPCLDQASSEAYLQEDQEDHLLRNNKRRSMQLVHPSMMMTAMKEQESYPESILRHATALAFPDPSLHEDHNHHHHQPITTAMPSDPPTLSFGSLCPPGPQSLPCPHHENNDQALQLLTQTMVLVSALAARQLGQGPIHSYASLGIFPPHHPSVTNCFPNVSPATIKAHSDQCLYPMSSPSPTKETVDAVAPRYCIDNESMWK